MHRKKSESKLVVACAFFIGCAAARVGTEAIVPAARAESTAPKWQAHCAFRESAGVNSPEYDERLAAADGWNVAMNRFGGEGWEPFQILLDTRPGDNTVQAVCFRRPLQ